MSKVRIDILSVDAKNFSWIIPDNRKGICRLRMSKYCVGLDMERSGQLALTASIPLESSHSMPNVIGDGTETDVEAMPSAVALNLLSRRQLISNICVPVKRRLW